MCGSPKDIVGGWLVDYKKLVLQWDLTMQYRIEIKERKHKIYMQAQRFRDTFKNKETLGYSVVFG